MVSLVALVGLPGVLRPTVVRAVTQPADSFVADEATPYHDGLVSPDSLTPPLSKLWSVDFTVNHAEYVDASIRTTLMVGDSVFVSDSDSTGGHVYALSRATGGLLWGPSGPGGPITYDSGKIFGVVVSDPIQATQAYALDAATGQELWSVALPGQNDYGDPTAANGVLYAVGDGMVALDGNTGALKWRSAWQDGTQDNVTVTDGGLYYTGPCSDIYAVNVADGSAQWTRPGWCGGGGTGPLSYHLGRLYGAPPQGSSQGMIVDAATGTQVGSYPTSAQVAFDGGTAFWTHQGNLQAYDLATQTILWTFAGDGGLSGQPLIVNGNVFVSSSTGRLYAVHETGGVGWTTTASAGAGSLSAASSTLLVTSGSVISAWGAASSAPIVSAVTPASGTATGGTTLTIRGQNLSSATGVSVGGTPATNVVVVSDTTVTATTPSEPNGTVPVTVQTPSGPSAFNPGESFTYYSDAPEVTGDDAVTFRMDPRHLASADSGSMGLPSVTRWTRQLGGKVSYPLIVSHRVFVIVGPSPGGGTNSLYALDWSSGSTVWGPVEVGQAYGLTYDNGRIFTVDSRDLVQAFNAADGAFVWSAVLSQTYADSQPTAVGGVLYVAGTGSGGTVEAIDESNGAVLWSQGVANGDWSAPTVADGHLYVGYACNYGFAFATANGSATWTHRTGCEGGGGGTTALYQGRLYLTYQGGTVLDQLTGRDVAGSLGGRLPTFFGNRTYYLNGSTLDAVDLGSSAPAWTFVGDGGLNSDPVEANGYVYVSSSSGNVYGLDAGTGQVRWNGAAGSPVLASGDGGSIGGGPPTTGMAIGDGLLVVPATDSLVAFGTAFPATTTAVTSSANPSAYGQSVTLTATVSSTDGGGQVSFFAAGGPIPSCQGVPLASTSGGYQATCTDTFSMAGTFPVTATYSGDATHASSTGSLGGGQTVEPPPGGPLVPLPPTRICDTRAGTGTQCTGLRLGPNSSIDVQVAGAAGVPNGGVAAVVLNVTAADPTAASYLTVYPTGVVQPTASNLNVTRGETIANLVEVPVGRGGAVTIYNNAGSTDVVVDVEDYVPTGPTAPGTGLFTPLSPTRVCDTRGGTATQCSGRWLGAGTVQKIQIAGVNGVPTSGVGAVVANLTVTDSTAPSYLTAYADGTARPLASNLNFVAGQTIGNRAIIPVGSDGAIDVYNNNGNTDVVVDVNGWFSDGSNSAATGSVFTGITPTRITDTRAGSGLPNAGSSLGPNSTLTVQVTGGGLPVPANATGVVLNLTVTDTTAGSFLTAYPAGVSRPLASDLNWTPGLTIPNLAVVKLSPSGAIDLYNLAGSTDLVLDVVGYYTG